MNIAIKEPDALFLEKINDLGDSLNEAIKDGLSL
jgi:hypothetical protein